MFIYLFIFLIHQHSQHFISEAWSLCFWVTFLSKGGNKSVEAKKGQKKKTQTGPQIPTSVQFEILYLHCESFHGISKRLDRADDLTRNHCGESATCWVALGSSPRPLPSRSSCFQQVRAETPAPSHHFSSFMSKCQCYCLLTGIISGWGSPETKPGHNYDNDNIDQTEAALQGQKCTIDCHIGSSKKLSGRADPSLTGVFSSPFIECLQKCSYLS